MSQEHIELRSPQSRKTACGALAGVGVVALVQMLSVNSLDVPLKVSVCSFAFSIPVLSAVLICALVEDSYTGFRAGIPPYLKAINISGYLAALIGVDALFFHFAVYAGLIFTVTSLIGIVVAALYINQYINQVATKSGRPEIR
jgi:hypothetical protein